MEGNLGIAEGIIKGIHGSIAAESGRSLELKVLKARCEEMVGSPLVGILVGEETVRGDSGVELLPPSVRLWILIR